MTMCHDDFFAPVTFTLHMQNYNKMMKKKMENEIKNGKCKQFKNEKQACCQINCMEFFFSSLL